MRAFLLAAPASGAGKTTVAVAVAAALADRGLRVQPFKVGPDFLDPTHLAAAAGRPCHSLDLWMAGEAAVRDRVARATANADLALVEGMMGLFDGVGGASDEGSSAAVARLLGLPVVLVVDASAAAGSLAALVHGFATFDPEVRLAGVIATRVGGPAHLETIGAALRAASAPPLLGALPFDPDLAVPERYLGLHQAHEVGAARLDRLADLAARHLDLERVAALTPNDAAWPRAAGGPAEGPGVPVATIGVARDAAFSFYYPATLERLAAAGAEIRLFSPLADPRLPEVNALYLGGGYPELHAEALAANRPMREAVRAFVAAGGPVYAECGGLLYLGDRLVDARGRAHDMAGALPGSVAVMTEGLVDFGYVAVETTRPTPLGPPGLRPRGHRFHCSRLLSPPVGARRAYRLARPDGAPWGEEGFVTRNVLASYVHLFVDGAPSIAASFVQAARAAAHAEAIGRCD